MVGPPLQLYSTDVMEEFAIFAFTGGLSAGVVIAIVVVLVVVVTCTVVLVVWYYKTRRGVHKSEDRAVAETTTSEYDTVMQQSSAYGKIKPGGGNTDSGIAMQESRAYGAGVVKQPTTNIPTYDVVM